jgi:hypothetical protein
LYTNGYAQTGFLGDYTWLYIPRKHLGMQASFQFISNLTDQDKLKNALTEAVPSIVPVQAEFVFDIGHWDVVSLIAGPVITYQSGIFAADIFINTGLYVVYPAPLRISASVTDSWEYSSSLSAKYLQPGFDAGINLRLNVNEYTGLRFFTEFKHTRAKGEIQQKYIDADSEEWNFNYKVPVSMVNIGIGLTYRL